jgi:hypothetical protein
MGNPYYHLNIHMASCVFTQLISAGRKTWAALQLGLLPEQAMENLRLHYTPW